MLHQTLLHQTLLRRSKPAPDLRSLRRLMARAAVAAALALTFALGGAPNAAAADDDDEAFETKVLKGLFGIKDAPPIEYRERSPLVVPPSRDLPPPQTTSVVADPSWPKDPDRQPKKKSRAPRDPNEAETSGRPLSPYELERGRRAGAGLTPTNSTREEQGAPLRPGELGYRGGILGALFKGGSEKDEVGVFKGEPPRATLTAPPTGYMTPSPNQPYGLSAKREAPKPFKLEDRGIGKDY